MAAAAPSVAAADTCGIRPVASPNTRLAVTMTVHNTVIAIKTIPLIVFTLMRQGEEVCPLGGKILCLFHANPIHTHSRKI